MTASPPIIAGLAIGDVLGAGGFATTWAARRGDAEVVVKVGHQRDLVVRARFDREAAILARVGAPAGPALLAAGELADGRPYLVLERVRGTTLRELAAAGPLPVQRVLALASALIDQVAAVHAAGVVHADLQPTNLLIDGDHVRLIDFGSARWIGAAGGAGGAGVEVTSHGVAVITAGYAAPEQRRGAVIDARADLYPIGVMLHELLAGSRPFAGEPRAEERGHQLLRPPPIARDLPPGLRGLIDDLLRKQPGRRPASALAVAARLAASSGEAPTPTGSSQPRGRPASAPAAPATSREAASAVVAGVIGPVPATELDAVARSAGAWVARRRGERTILVWPGARPAMFDRARRAARHLAALHAARIVLHVARLRLRAGVDGTGTAYGAELDDPRWLDGGDAVTETPGFAASAPDAVEPALVGRDVELAALIARGRAALLGAPALCTLEGEPGTGRTRLLRAAAAALAPVRTVAIDATPGGQTPAGLAVLLDARSPLIVTLDDADRIDPAVLDTIEDGLIRAGTRALWVLAAATPTLRRTRPQWGRRLEHHHVVALDELGADDAIDLATALLAPVEHAPRDAVASLMRACGRRPRDLVDGVRWFVAQGGVQQVHGGGYQVATDRIDAIARDGDDARLRLALEGLAPELRDLAHAVAVIGDDLTVSELEAIQVRLDEEGEHLEVDAESGLGFLVDEGLLVARAGVWSFRDAAVGEGAARAAAPARRAALHRAALACARDRDDRARVARHGIAAGEVAEGVAALVGMGRSALAACRFADAERHLTQAVDTGGAPPALARAARILRGRARYLQGRHDDAIADLAAVVPAAEAAGDRPQAAEASLELATAHDFATDVSAAAAAIAEARRLIADHDDPALALGLGLADARQLLREGDIGASARALALVADDARRAGDDFVEVVALVLLGPALAIAGELEASEAAFARAFASCARRGDAIHAAAAYGNRLLLRQARGDQVGALADLEASLRLARQSGDAGCEAMGLHNLAELHFRAGRDDDEVIRLAERALLLDERFLAAPNAGTYLLLGRVHAARGDDPAAAPYLAAVRALPAEQLVLFEHLVLDALGDHAGADALDRAATLLPPDELEVLYWLLRRGTAPIDLAAAAARAATLLADQPLYLQRLRELGIAPITGRSPGRS